jgi:hypothetical protein
MFHPKKRAKDAPETVYVPRPTPVRNALLAITATTCLWAIVAFQGLQSGHLAYYPVVIKQTETAGTQPVALSYSGYVEDLEQAQRLADAGRRK